MKRPWIKWCALVIAALAAIVGVPIIINECYKANSGYMTIWGAADVLSYYGTILGTFVTVATIVVTISFTRKQIQRESYLKNETEKWAKIEDAFTGAISTISPYQSLVETMDYTTTDPTVAITQLQRYLIDSTCAFDKVLLFMNKEEYLKLRDIVVQLEGIRDELHITIQAEIEAYARLRELRNCEFSRKMFASDYDNSAQPEEYKSTDEQTCDSKINDIYAEIESLTQNIAKIYAEEFRPVFLKKRDRFEDIYRDIRKKANQLLRFGGKDNADA